MNVALVSLLYPYPPDTGMRIGNYYLALELARAHKVHLITFDGYSRQCHGPDPLMEAGVGHTSVVESYGEWKQLSMVLLRLRCWISGMSYFGAWQKRYLGRVLDVIRREGIDCVFAHRAQSAFMFVDVDAVPVVAGITELTGRHLKWMAGQEKNPLLRIWRAREARLLLDMQLNLCRWFRWSFNCMREEIAWVEQQVGATSLEFIAYGVDTGYYTPDPIREEQHLVGSIGNQWNMGGRNVAISIFPCVRKQIPEARLLLLGGTRIHPPLRGIAQRDSSIELPGYLSQDDFLDQARRPSVYVFPIDFATGTKNSVLMAMSLAKPIVATRCAMAGVDVDEAGVILADCPRAFAEEIVALLGDRDRCLEMGVRNREHAVRHLDWGVYVGRVRHLLESAAGDSES